jgi:hypothetical protein
MLVFKKNNFADPIYSFPFFDCLNILFLPHNLVSIIKAKLGLKQKNI